MPPLAPVPSHVRRSLQLDEVSPQPLMNATPLTLRKVNETKIRITPIPFYWRRRLLTPATNSKNLAAGECRFARDEGRRYEERT